MAISDPSGAELGRGRAYDQVTTSIDLLEELESDHRDRIDWVELEGNLRDFREARIELDAMAYVIAAREAEFEGYQRLAAGHEKYGNGEYSTAEFEYAAAGEQFSTARREVEAVMDHEVTQVQGLAYFEYGKLHCEVEQLEEAAHHYEVGAQDARRGDSEGVSEAERLALAALEEADGCRDNPFEGSG